MSVCICWELLCGKNCQFTFSKTFDSEFSWWFVKYLSFLFHIEINSNQTGLGTRRDLAGPDWIWIHVIYSGLMLKLTINQWRLVPKFYGRATKIDYRDNDDDTQSIRPRKRKGYRVCCAYNKLNSNNSEYNYNNAKIYHKIQKKHKIMCTELRNWS